VSLIRRRRNGTYILDKREFSLRLRKILGFLPRNLRIYELAFIHRSASHVLSDGTKINNERLEYLGDAILDAILSEYLFDHYPDYDEGELTKIRSRLVNRELLNKLAKSMGINTLLISHINKKVPTRHLYGDALEALIGSVFVDKGYKKTRNFILRHILDNFIDLNAIVNTETDYKSQVFQWAQKLKKQISFNYNEDYNFNDKKSVFTTTLRIDHEIFGEGCGSSKKEAEQKASLEGWDKINRIGFID
jgi:ribonuclease-3